MSNVNVAKRLEQVSKLMQQAVVQAEQYSGVSREQAARIDRECSAIIEQAGRIAAEARAAGGNKSAGGLLRKLRKALGYTYP